MEPGEIIREARKKRGWTQAELGARIDPPVSQSQIYRWEKSKNLTMETLRRIHAVLPLPGFERLFGHSTHLPLDEAGAEALRSLPGDLVAALQEIWSDPDRREEFDRWRWLYTEAPDEFRRHFLALIDEARKLSR